MFGCYLARCASSVQRKSAVRAFADVPPSIADNALGNVSYLNWKPLA